MKISYIEEMLKKHDYSAAISHFLIEYREVVKEKKLSHYRRFIRSFKDEKQIKLLLQVLDASLMDQMSGILIRDSYRRLKTPQTALWYCEQLIDENRLIEAEDLLKELENKDLPAELREKLYFNMAIALIQMRRLKAADAYLKKCAEVAEDSMDTRWAYYYLQSGEWDKAIERLELGKKDEKEGAIAYSLLVQHFALQGEMEKTQTVLDDALRSYPDFPKLMVEKIRLCSKQKRWMEMEKVISELNDLTPFHEYKDMCEYYTADALYEQKEFKKLEEYLKEHNEFKTGSHYKKFNDRADKKHRMLNFKPVVQKYNFCVPACGEMIFSMFGKTYSQDEIAESVYTISGSKLTKAIEYFEEKEFLCRYFFGNQELFKTLIDRNAAVMINIDYPTTSHVQLLAGYDDNLMVFHVQDPNLRGTHEVMYEDLEREFGNNGVLSIAIVPEKDAAQLDVLSEKEHEIAERLFSLTEEDDSKLSVEDQAFLKDHLQHMAVSAYIIKYLPNKVDEAILETASGYVFAHSEESEYRSLSAAMGYFSINKIERSEEYLKQIKFKHYLSNYWYLKGRISYSSDDYTGAFASFKEAVKNEPDDHILWSYLALTELNQDNLKEAIKYSEIAMDINEEDAFPQINHGMILMEMDKFVEARALFHRILNTDKHNGYAWYQRAKCDKELGRYHLALRGFQTAISLEPDVSLGYRELAGLYEFVYEDTVKAKETLQKGINECGENELLIQELGDLYERAGDYAQARIWYEKAAELDAEDVYSRISLASIFKEEGKLEQCFQSINLYYGDFQKNSEFLVNAGKLMWAAAEEMEEKESQIELALSYVEKGILYATEADLEEALEVYVNLVSETPFYRRGLKFLESLRNDKTREEFLLISYIGCLYEAHGYLDKAKEYFDEAIAIKNDDILPFYRLGEIACKIEDNDEAEKYYKKVLELDSSHEQAMLDLASIAKRREDREQELDYLLRAFNLNPYCIPVETVLQVMEKPSEIEEFKGHLLSLEKKVEQAFFYDALAHVHGKLGDIKEEENCLSKAYELAPSQFQILVHQVKLWMKQGKVKQAKAQLHTLIMENSENKSLYDTWIELMSSTRSMPKLDSEIRKMKLSNQEKSMVFMNAAAAYERHLQSMQDAVEEVEEQKSWLKRIRNFSKVSLNFGILIGLYEESIKLDRENSAAVFWFVDFYENSGLSEDAIKVLEQSIRHNWDPDIAYRLAGLYVNEYGTVSEKKAVKYLSEACNLLETLLEDNEDPDYFNLFGVALTELGEYEEAENAHLRAVEIEPAVEKGYFHLSRIYEAMEKYKKAEKAIAKAIDIDPNDHDNYNQLGLIYKHQNKMEQALGAVEKAISMEPEDLISLYNRACYLSILGRFKESADQLETLYKLDEEFIFTEMAEDDEDLELLKEAGYFPLNPQMKR
ncbi:tetratricopeptide repeat protein [Bacillus sp. UMB0893]|uniref:tetratricopeptide repeat protein n=1 Tax=Bacillus sp. UMB0893 TaxID=2066053 RepID=UPI000C78CC78|nr:tetratricopeptide repeat protein [Bacillus sp. UMB0893]PLR68913.1 hypothetical protein CYJ36_00140 [Bacillus sp. UMB0893]